MKVLAAFAAVAALFVVEGGRVHIRSRQNAFLQNINQHRNASGVSGEKANKYGSSRCPCIGIDNVDGTTKMTYEGQNFTYAADVGARCEAWEEEAHPDCKGDNAPSWCQQAWCFVNPCDCDLNVPAKSSAYIPNGKYHGRPIHYSYDTCGGVDEWSSDEMKVKAQEADNKEMCATPVDASLWGKEKCRCIGMQGKRVTVQIDNETEFFYPTDMGSSCQAWDLEGHPGCKNGGGLPFCPEKWCFVDPCSCNVDTLSRPSVYWPDGKHRGRPIHFSYATCGSVDHWSMAAQREQATESKDMCSEL